MNKKQSYNPFDPFNLLSVFNTTDDIVVKEDTTIPVVSFEEQLYNEYNKGYAAGLKAKDEQWRERISELLQYDGDK